MSRVPRPLSAAFAVGIAAAGLAVATAPAASAAPCTDIDVPVARGTFEPGTLGVIVGDPVYQAVQNALRPRSLSSYRVNYPADLGQPTSVQKGNADLVDHVTARPPRARSSGSSWSATPRAPTSSTTRSASAARARRSAARS